MDRMDVLEAYYVFAMLHHEGQGSYLYKVLSRLSRMGYQPGVAAQKGKLQTEGARAVYLTLCHRHLRPAHRRKSAKAHIATLRHGK